MAALFMRSQLRHLRHHVPRPSLLRPRLARACISTSVTLRGNAENLEQAKERLKLVKEDPGNLTKLKLYALYKQATIGPCNTPKPGAFDFVGKAKWSAWDELKDMSQSDAVQQYVQIVDELVGSASSSSSSSSTASSTSSSPSASAGNTDLVVSDEGGIRTVLLNRPKMKNALNLDMYANIEAALNTAAKDDSVVAMVMTGAGDYYCSGNDLSNFLNIPPGGPEELAQRSSKILQSFVSAFIQFPKPLIAAVNGPAIGISVTVLGLFDLVYAADNATFHTPFMALGQSPEGCSSFLFPQIMSPARANEMLLAGRKLTAAEAYERGLITRVFPSGEFKDRVKELLTEISKLPPRSLQKSKELIRAAQIDKLEEINKQECELLVERWLSEECMQAIMNFMQRKK